MRIFPHGRLLLSLSRWRENFSFAVKEPFSANTQKLRKNSFVMYYVTAEGKVFVVVVVGIALEADAKEPKKKCVAVEMSRNSYNFMSCS